MKLGSRLSFYIEPRDAWIGVYVAKKAIYVCPLPFCVLRWERRWINIGENFRRLAPKGAPDGDA